MSTWTGGQKQIGLWTEANTTEIAEPLQRKQRFLMVTSNLSGALGQFGL